MKKKPTVWLARDAFGSRSYELFVDEKPRQSNSFWVIKDDDGYFQHGAILCPAQFEKAAPKTCHLKPGEGPIEIDVKITRAKKK